MRWWIIALAMACQSKSDRDEDGLADKDGDGSPAKEDCDDNDPSAYPGADEVCDGVDNDCDGFVDGQDDSVTDAELWYVDADGDGAGSADATERQCTRPSGYAGNADDCDDDDRAVNPDAP